MTTTTNPSSIFDTLALQRRTLAIALGAVGVIFTAIAIWWGVWGWPTPVDASDPDADTSLLGKKDKDKEKEKEKDKDKEKEAKPRKHSEDYFPAAIWAGLLAVVAFCGAAWLVTQPLPNEAAASTVRAEVITFGSIAGVLTSLLGVAFAVSWYKSLFLWVNENNVNEARWVLIAMAVFIAGLMIIFFSVQLARTEERANAILRRVAYGFNAVFMGLLLFLVLASLNVISFIKIPNTLVTNDAAFTSLSEPSKTFLRSLDKPVRAYLIMPENFSFNSQGLTYRNMYSDCRGLLAQCEEQSRNFKVTYLSPGLDTLEIVKLLDKMQVPDKNEVELGIVLAFGEKEDEFVQIPVRDLITQAPMSEDDSLIAFQGEQRIMSEIISKTNAQSNTVVYFTQDHGELSVTNDRTDPRRTAYESLAVLRDRKVEVKPLKFDLTNPTIPSDAAVVVVAGPQRTIEADSPTYIALQKYLKPTEPDKAPGKLLAFLPALRSPNGRIMPSGLEPLLLEYGVQVDPNHRLYSYPPIGIPTERGTMRLPADHQIGGMSDEVTGPVSRIFAQQPFLFRDARPIRVAQGNPMYKVTPLVTIQKRMHTWVETDYSVAVETKFRELADNEQLRTEKQYSNNGPPLAVMVSLQAPPSSGPGPKKADKPLMMIFSSDTILQDQPTLPIIEDSVRQLAISDSVDWLREREANMGIAPRKLPVYFLAKAPSLGSLIMLLGMLSACVIALGVGVWLSRRK